MIKGRRGSAVGAVLYCIQNRISKFMMPTLAGYHASAAVERK
jgi:hypothetical protein